MMDFVTFCKYLEWAEARIAKLIDDLTDEEFTHRHERIGRSIRDLLEHMWASLAGFQWQFQPERFRELAEEAAALSRQELMKRWRAAPLDLAQKIETREFAEVEIPIGNGRTVTFDGTAWLLSYTDHATYHRAQLVLMLRLLGKGGVNTDYGTFISENQ